MFIRVFNKLYEDESIYGYDYKIAVASTKRYKLESVKKAICFPVIQNKIKEKHNFGDELKIAIMGYDVPSNVANQPIGDEIKKGAIYRLNSLKKLINADLYISIEGGYYYEDFDSTTKTTTFVCVETADGNKRLERSSSISLPGQVYSIIESNNSIDRLISEHIGTSSISSFGGAVSYVTDGEYQRIENDYNTLKNALLTLYESSNYSYVKKVCNG